MSVCKNEICSIRKSKRKRGRPKRVQQAVMTAMLLLCFMWLIPMKSQASTVYNGYNYYLGMYFGDSEEDVAKMEQMLLDDGYVCISKGGEYEEWGEFLVTMNYYWYGYVLTCPEDYTVYMPLRVVEMAQNSECGSWTVNSSTVVADRYVFGAVLIEDSFDPFPVFRGDIFGAAMGAERLRHPPKLPARRQHPA